MVWGELFGDDLGDVFGSIFWGMSLRLSWVRSLGVSLEGVVAECFKRISLRINMGMIVLSWLWGQGSLEMSLCLVVLGDVFGDFFGSIAVVLGDDFGDVFGRALGATLYGGGLLSVLLSGVISS